MLYSFIRKEFGEVNFRFFLEEGVWKLGFSAEIVGVCESRFVYGGGEEGGWRD